MARCAVFVLTLAAALALICAAGTVGQAQTDWQMLPDPVVKLATLPAWDNGQINEVGGVVKVGDHCLMTYEGVRAGGSRYADRRTGIATSPDGIHWFKFAANPVLGPQCQNSCLLYDPDDLAAPYKMWYDTSGSALGPRIRYATSNDALHWKLVGDVLTPGPVGSYDDRDVFQCQVAKAGSTYYMYYSARSGPLPAPPTTRCIGVATSPDGVNWTHVGVALPAGDGAAWDNLVGCPHVLYKDGQFLMWYKGGPGSSPAVQEQIGFATSADGLTFARYAQDPIVSATGNPALWPYRALHGPSVIWDGTRYHMWFGGVAGDGTTAVGYAVSAPGSPTSFTIHSAPVLTQGPAGWAFDAGSLNAGGVARVGSEYRMAYAGTSVGEPSSARRLGIASSHDGVHWFKYAGNPVLGPMVGNPCLLYDPLDEAAPYKTWYDTAGTEIRYATSTDGIQWNDMGTALPRGPAGSYDERNVGQAVVARVGGIYYMYYVAWANPGTVPPPERCIALATSLDGVSWTKIGPALPSAGGTAWDYAVGCPHVLYANDQFLMWYKGMALPTLDLQQIGFATSTDGGTFTRYAGNPVLSPTADPAVFPFANLYGPSVLGGGESFRMWFGCTETPGFGYAISAPDSTIEPTPEGAGVSVSNSALGVAVQFDEVGTAGQTVIAETTAPPISDPTGYQVGNFFFEISTTAGYFGPVEITISYDDSAMTPAAEAALRLLHYNENETRWEDITVALDTAANTITGRTSSFSTFALAEGPVFNGYLEPINNDGSSVFKLKSTIPVKFRLSAPDGSATTNADAHLFVAKISNNATGTVLEATSTSAASVGNAFRYDSQEQQYIFNLGTKTLSTGTWLLRTVITIPGVAGAPLQKEVRISLR